MIYDYVYNGTPPVYFDKHPDSDALCCAFTSQGGAGKIFEFRTILDKLNSTNNLYFSPVVDGWYGLGIDKHKYNSVSAVTELIVAVKKKYNLNKVILLGSSMGGTGVIRYSVYLSQYFPVTSIAFGPKTFFGTKDRKTSDLLDLFNYKHINRDNIDLNIFYDPKHVSDNPHALNMESVATLHQYPGTSHNIAKVLRNNGELIKILYKAIEGKLHE